MSLVRTPTPIALSLVVLSGATSAVPAHGQLAVSVGDESIRVFQECVSAYILMRQQIAEQLLADWVEADADTRFRRRLAAAIQATRRDSRPATSCVPASAKAFCGRPDGPCETCAARPPGNPDGSPESAR